MFTRSTRDCSTDIYNARREEVNQMLLDKALQHRCVYFFKPTNVYRREYEDLDGVHFTDDDYRPYLVALGKALSWFINRISK
jgi:hypothetical protein